MRPNKKLLTFNGYLLSAFFSLLDVELTAITLNLLHTASEDNGALPFYKLAVSYPLSLTTFPVPTLPYPVPPE